MKLHQLDALRIVLDLAAGNALDPYDKDTRRDDALYAEATKQQDAIAIVENLWTEEMNS